MGAERPAYPLGSWPLEMRAETAAAYCDEPSVEAFLAKVGRVYSRPARPGGCEPKWHRAKLDADLGRGPEVKAVGFTDRVGTIYVCGFGKYIKIGYTSYADAIPRIEAIQQGLPEPVTVYGEFAGTVADEKKLHKRFAHLKLRGECFKNEGEMSAWLRTLCTIDV